MQKVTRAIPGGRRSPETCRQGHPYDAENTYIDKQGKRKCRACGAERARLKREAAPKKVAPPSRQCPECGGEVTSTDRPGGRLTYCSDECRRAVVNRQAAAREKEKRARLSAPKRSAICAECSGPIPPQSSGPIRKFCSDECKARTHNRRQNRRRLSLKDPDPEQRLCAHCNAAFTPSRSDQVYCRTGKSCAQSAYRARKRAGEPLRQVEQTLQCQECGNTFTAFKSNARWCSSLCKNRHTGRAKSRRRGAVSAVPYTDLAIFERDGWRCHICGDVVDRNLPRTDWDGATIDHVVPLSAGGSDTPDNVATAHWRCNHAKRATLAS